MITSLPADPASPLTRTVTVGDVMSRAVVAAYPAAGIEDVAHALERNRIDAVPVIDDSRHVVGVVAVVDLLDRAAPPGATARDLMTAPAVTATADTPVGHARALMAQLRIRSMPVVDRDGTLAGMVARSDLLPAYLS